MKRTLGSKQEQEARRLAAGRMLLAGKRNVEVVRAWNVSPSSVKRWKKVVRRQGLAGLHSRASSGRRPKLSAAQRKSLTRILRKGARAAGFDSQLCTGKRVAELIRREFQVVYHPHHVLKLLRQLGFTLQRPQRRAREQDSRALEHWRSVEWPRIKRGGPLASADSILG